MMIFDKEQNILNYFIDDVRTIKNVAMPKFDISSLKILKNIFKMESWIDSSGKNEPPPDFYNDKYKVMMEVMRVDDTGGKRDGKKRNPTKEHERRLINKYGLDKLENVKVIMNVDSGLPTREDHNYKFYKLNFIATVNKHKEHINNYRENHPNYKLIFFVMDESTQYFVGDGNNDLAEGKEINAYAHICYNDIDFVRVFSSIDVDYLIWYTPFKYCLMKSGNMERVCPKAVIFNIKKMGEFITVKYNENLMESMEI